MTKLRFVSTGDVLEATEDFPYAKPGVQFPVNAGLKIDTPSGPFDLATLQDNLGGLTGLKKVDSAACAHTPISCSFSEDLSGRGYTYLLPNHFEKPSIGQPVVVIGPKGGRKTVYVVALNGDINPEWKYKYVLEIRDPEPAPDLAAGAATDEVKAAMSPAPNETPMMPIGERAGLAVDGTPADDKF